MPRKGECHFRLILFLHRLRHLIFHRVIQVLDFQLAVRITCRFQVIRQLLRESLVEGGVFHVDDHDLDLLIRDQFSEAIGFFLRGQPAD
jgi:hypothetical protein